MRRALTAPLMGLSQRPLPFRPLLVSFPRNLHSSSAPQSRPPSSRTPSSRTDSYQLAARVKQLSRNGHLEEAISLVKASPSTSSTTPVWNGLLHEILLTKKWRLAYQTWMDMKRKGVKPNVRSWVTFFGGLTRMSKVVGKKKRTDQDGRELGEEEGRKGMMDKIKTIFAQWLVYAEEHEVITTLGRRPSSTSTSTIDSEDEISNIPTNAYLSFLAASDQHSSLLSTFHSMPKDGPLAPDSLTYSLVLSSLRAAATPEAFSEAMSLWRKMQVELAEIDCKTVSTLISFCREVPTKRPDDMRLGLDIAREFFGLVSPKDEHLLVLSTTAKGKSRSLDKHQAVPRPRVLMDSGALSNVLALALEVSQYNLVIAWFDQVRDYPQRFGTTLLDNRHANLALVSMAAKKDSATAEGESSSPESGHLLRTLSKRHPPLPDLLMWMRKSSYPSLQPTLETYTNAIQVCWRAADLKRALDFLDLMTGASKLSTPSSRLPKFEPNERIMSTIVQTALATRDRGKMLKAVELAEEFGFDRMRLPASERGTIRRSLPDADEDDAAEDGEMALPPVSEREGQSYTSYWTYQLTRTIAKVIHRILNTRSDSTKDLLERERKLDLTKWMEACDKWLDESGSRVKDREESMRSRREKLEARRASEERTAVRDPEDDYDDFPAPGRQDDKEARARSFPTTSPSRNWDEGARRQERKAAKSASSNTESHEPPPMSRGPAPRPARRFDNGVERNRIQREVSPKSGIRYSFQRLQGDRKWSERGGVVGRARRTSESDQEQGREARGLSWR